MTRLSGKRSRRLNKKSSKRRNLKRRRVTKRRLSRRNKKYRNKHKSHRKSRRYKLNRKSIFRGGKPGEVVPLVEVVEVVPPVKVAPPGEVVPPNTVVGSDVVDPLVTDKNPKDILDLLIRNQPSLRVDDLRVDELSGFPRFIYGDEATEGSHIIYEFPEGDTNPPLTFVACGLLGSGSYGVVCKMKLAGRDAPEFCAKFFIGPRYSNDGQSVEDITVDANEYDLHQGLNACYRDNSDDWPIIHAYCAKNGELTNRLETDDGTPKCQYKCKIVLMELLSRVTSSYRKTTPNKQKAQQLMGLYSQMRKLYELGETLTYLNGIESEARDKVRPLIYCDAKFGNTAVDKDNNLKLIDLGSAIPTLFKDDDSTELFYTTTYPPICGVLVWDEFEDIIQDASIYINYELINVVLKIPIVTYLLTDSVVFLALNLYSRVSGDKRYGQLNQAGLDGVIGFHRILENPTFYRSACSGIDTLLEPLLEEETNLVDYTANKSFFDYTSEVKTKYDAAGKSQDYVEQRKVFNEYKNMCEIIFNRIGNRTDLNLSIKNLDGEKERVSVDLEIYLHLMFFGTQFHLHTRYMSWNLIKDTVYKLLLITDVTVQRFIDSLMAIQGRFIQREEGLNLDTTTNILQRGIDSFK